ncbi:MAG: NUDIX hydrolase [Bacteroidota bacterium]
MKISTYYLQPRLLVAVDCVILGFDGTALKVLVIKRGFEPEKGKWSLPGGFVSADESTEEAAARVLGQLTGLQQVYMEQLHCFSAINRDVAGRVISIAYFALINIQNYQHHLSHKHEAAWVPLRSMPALIFDHNKMVDKAWTALRERVANHPIGFELLPTRFTLPQLQCLYEAIYNSKLDKRNFSRKVKALGVLKRLTEKEKTSSRKGAFFYVFDRKKYQRLARQGMRLI